ncbi:type II secretion system F family protein [Roseobacter sp. HKCCA0434]|uniref:type II secretion system F family protein n=1 Tax=Roseobacter sp. HKCCA0434 TaxID=3079297 RepID=UPI0029059AD4|nr:type II secretion system F family protein [Roseobacter sp. HKCCA0434]
MDSLLSGLDSTYTFLEAAFGPLGPLYASIALMLLLVALAAPIALRRPEDRLDRLHEAERAGVSARPEIVPQQTGLKLRHDPTSKGLSSLAPYLEPQDQKEFSEIRLKLTRAGYRSRSAVSSYYFLRMALGLGLLGVGLVFYFVMAGDNASITQMLLYVTIPGLIGYMGPTYWVTRRLQERQEEIQHGFPDALDLMLVCVEAGQSLDQAILRVSEEIRVGYPVLAEEFEIVANEVRAGKDRVSVLRDMAERCGVSDVSSFVTVLIQSASFGTSIASALRVYGAEMRDKRVMRAEEKANTLPTKMTLGTMMFTVPPLLIILVGPSVYDIMQVLGGG